MYLVFFGIFMLLQMSVSKILAYRRLWYFKTTKILQKWLQTWFILLHFGLINRSKKNLSNLTPSKLLDLPPVLGGDWKNRNLSRHAPATRLLTFEMFLKTYFFVSCIWIQIVLFALNRRQVKSSRNKKALFL